MPAGPRIPEGLEVTAAEVTAELGSLFDDSFFDSVEPLPARSAPALSAPADARSSASTESLRLRLPAPYAEQLQELATQRGVTPAALLATWVMERLATEGRPAVPAPDPKPPQAPLNPPSVAPAQRSSPDVTAAETPAETAEATSPEAREPATASWDLGLPDDLVSLLSPVDHLNPIGDLAPPSPAAVTPLFRNPPPAHASEEPQKGPRHRAPEPVINLHSRRKI